MKNRITDRQREIYEFIRTSIEGRSIPPTIREIGKAFGIRSTNGVEKHLAALERSGFVVRERGKSRSISLRAGGKRPLATVPLLGRVAAGMPVLSPENHEGEFAVDISLFKLRSPENLFALKVKGESMIDAHIVDGDTVIVRVQSAAQNGDIVVALVNGEATVKRLFIEKSHVRLQPENSSMKPLNIDRGDFRIIGRVVGVVRRI
ncbi:MAG TPA: transcriptional repressor LexA [Nitrospirota bacterium]|nr:transcriptional repressor LexA [Nitrospirota bacterium]